ncbi:MAG: hypothetical protein U9N59_08695 [Campylobacterota bacterium]|nr:hypothetical protein [Campylobacterota bacterium]
MKRISLSLLTLVSLVFAETKVGDVISSSGGYGCPTPKEAIHAYKGINDPSAKGQYGAAYLNSYMKYNSCKKIVYGLDMKIKKIELWGPPENRSKFRVLMLELPGNEYVWSIL